MSRVPRRDDQAYAEFVVASQTQLRRTAYLLCGDWHRASDITQDALVKLYVAWPRLRDEGSMLAYARTAVTSVFIDQTRRRSSTEHPTEVLPERPSGDFTRAHATRTALMEALLELPPRQRACVVLRYFEELSVKEVSAALGCGEGTVKSQTSKAIDHLRRLLDDVELDLEVATW